MYLKHFGFRKDPFKLDPSLDFVYVSSAHEETIAHLVYGIEQGESFILITGGIGTGKTLALHFLLDQVVTTFKTAFINVTKVNFLELLKLILDDLEVPFDRSGDRADLLHTLKSFLLAARGKNEKVLLVVDEAQDLDQETLESLRLLSNLSQPGKQVLQIILTGQPELKRHIASPGLEQLDQRIRVRYQLETLSNSEIGPYIEYRLKVAGADEGLFAKGAIDRIFQFSKGVPRLVNYHADRALLAAYVDGANKVKAGHVEEEVNDDIPVGAQKNLDEQSVSQPQKKSNRGRNVLWFFLAIIFVTGIWYTYARTDLFQTLFSHNELVKNDDPVLVHLPAASEEIPAGALVEKESIEPEEENVRVSRDTLQATLEVVAVSTLTPDVDEKPLQIAPDQTPAFAIHVASFQNKERASRQLSRFEKTDKKIFIEETNIGDKLWFRLYFGPYATEVLAQEIGQKMKDEGIIEYFLVTIQSQNKKLN